MNKYSVLEAITEIYKDFCVDRFVRFMPDIGIIVTNNYDYYYWFNYKQIDKLNSYEKILTALISADSELRYFVNKRNRQSPDLRYYLLFETIDNKYQYRIVKTSKNYNDYLKHYYTNTNTASYLNSLTEINESEYTELINYLSEEVL